MRKRKTKKRLSLKSLADELKQARFEITSRFSGLYTRVNESGNMLLARDQEWKRITGEYAKLLDVLRVDLDALSMNVQIEVQRRVQDIENHSGALRNLGEQIDQNRKIAEMEKRVHSISADDINSRIDQFWKQAAVFKKELDESRFQHVLAVNKKTGFLRTRANVWVREHPMMGAICRVCSAVSRLHCIDSSNDEELGVIEPGFFIAVCSACDDLSVYRR